MNNYVWEVAHDYLDVHSLLCDSDRYKAGGTQPPTRDLENSKKYVDSHSVHILKCVNIPVAMFTLISDPAFKVDLSIFPPSIKPAYITRLAINPEWVMKEPLLGMQCLRKAIEIAGKLNFTCIRSEINPQVSGIMEMLKTLGFKVYPTHTHSGSSVVYLQKDLD